MIGLTYLTNPLLFRMLEVSEFSIYEMNQCTLALTLEDILSA